MNSSKKMEDLLAKNEKARNWTSTELGLEYMKEYYCNTELEKKIITDIYSRGCPSWATLKRTRSYIQNTLGLYRADEVIHQKRNKQEIKIRKEYRKSWLFESIWRWFKK